MKKLLLILLVLSLCISGCSNSSPTPTVELKEPKTSEYYKTKLYNAEVIAIEADIATLVHHYTIKVNGEKVATVEGKFMTAFGDTFTLKDANGKILYTETEIKRWSLFDLERLAEIKDPDGTTVGYIGEQYASKIFSMGWTFYFFDVNKKEIGISDQINLTLLKENNIYNSATKDLIYHVKADFNPFYSQYVLYVKAKDKQIPVHQAIFMVCIEDVIHSSKK